MKVRIKETGEVKELNIFAPNGVNWVVDLIGNAGGFVNGQFEYNVTDEVYDASQGDYDWWHNYIAETEKIERDIELIADKFGIEPNVIRDKIAEAIGDTSDYGDHRRLALEIMGEIEREYM